MRNKIKSVLAKVINIHTHSLVKSSKTETKSPPAQRCLAFASAVTHEMLFLEFLCVSSLRAGGIKLVSESFGGNSACGMMSCGNRPIVRVG